MSSPPYPSLFVTNNTTPSPTLSLDAQLLPLTPLEPPGLSTSSTSSVASTRSSPRSDLFEPRGDFAQSFDVATFDTLTLDNQLGRLFPNPSAPFENFGLEQTLSSCSPPFAPLADLSTWLDGREALPRYATSDVFSYPQGVRMDGQDFMPDYTSLGPVPSHNTSPSQVGVTVNPAGASFDSSVLTNALEPTAEDLEHYRMSILSIHV